jgi:anti-anti-sigma regulatory factor
VECWIGVATDSGRRVVRVAGRLSAAHVPELLTACAGGDNVLELDLDLSELVSADTAAIEVLQRVRSKGATLVGTPGYIRLKIDSTASR